jgi:hypothetical protein
MRQTTGTRKSPGEKIVKDIKRATRKLVLPRFSCGLFRAIFAMKEIWNGNEIHRR